MYKIANYSKQDREILFANAAHKLNLAPIVIEKDFWITIILDYLFNKNKYKDLFVFKGGTCLSKCYKVVNRFSEDIDIVLDWSAIGLNSEEAMKKRSSKKRDAFVNSVRSKTKVFLLEKLIPEMQKDFSKLFKDKITISIDPSESRTVLITYSNSFSDDFIPSIIKLEIGCLSAIKPNNTKEISSYVYEVFPKTFKSGKTIVKAVLAESIFWEKVLILYQNKDKEKLGDRQSRHYYDMACLCTSPIKDKALKNLNLLEQAYFITKTFYYSKLYEKDSIQIKDINLIPNEQNYKLLEKDYEKMQHMILTEKKLTFKQIIEEVEKLDKFLKRVSE